MRAPERATSLATLVGQVAGLVMGVLPMTGCGAQGSSAYPPPSPSSSAQASGPNEHTSWAKRVSTGCAPSGLELVVPFYEGLDLDAAPTALRESGHGNIALAYPGPLSMPLVAWRCRDGQWSALVVAKPEEHSAELTLSTVDDALDVHFECFGTCALHELHARGTWADMASTIGRLWNIQPTQMPLASRFDHFRFYVRQWVSNDGEALRSDWQPQALRERLAREDARTIQFAFGLDPNEVDLEGKLFWSHGALEEARAIVTANPAVAQLHWLNLRTYKYAIPRLDIRRPPPADITAAAKVYADGVHTFPQYVFESLEMCLGSAAWQASRFEQMKKLVELGYRVIALDEFPTAPRWDAQGCHATNHLHRPGDFEDEWRISRAFIAKLADYAHAHGVLLTSEEPSAMLLPFTSGYMDGSYNDPPDMYESWQRSDHAKRIPLFSTMFGALVTPYTRSGVGASPPKGWLVQEKVSP